MRYFFLSPNFSRSEIKSEGYGVDALDGGMRGGGFGYKKAANRRGLMKRSDQLKRRTDRRQAAWRVESCHPRRKPLLPKAEGRSAYGA